VLLFPFQLFLRAGSRRRRAVFFMDDNPADAGTRAILELGIKVPEQLAIVTHGNAGRSFSFPVPLTCIEFDPAEVTQTAWAMLQKLIEDKPVEEPTVWIAPRLRQGKFL